MPCSDDATLENAIKMHWKPQLSNRKFLKSSEVKLPLHRKKEVEERLVSPLDEPSLCLYLCFLLFFLPPCLKFGLEANTSSLT